MADSVVPDDDQLPAAAHLAGPDADAVLRTALDAVGGRLDAARPVHIQYRPGSDVVVRFDSTVSWNGAAASPETLLASTSRRGAPEGTLPVVATVDGRELEVGVWRWPFDPMMPGLIHMVRPDRAAERLGGLVDGPLELHVVAYRPTERAVIRVRDAAGVVIYLKILPPAQIGPLVDRHERLIAAGLPVPRVLAVDEVEGWMAMAELSGTTLRERIKAGIEPWPEPSDYQDLLHRVRSVSLDGAPRSTRTADALGHATMLAVVAPELSDRIERLVSALQPAAQRASTRRATVHGDLHEAQLIVDDGRIVGLLDIDDAGVGDPLDDYATPLGHLLFRTITADCDDLRSRVGNYAARLASGFRDDMGALRVDDRELGIVTAGVLVGLATGPYRIQHPHWRRDVERLLACAEHHLAEDHLRTAPGDRRAR
jgi:aminoglycoside phosphotransferase